MIQGNNFKGNSSKKPEEMNRNSNVNSHTQLGVKQPEGINVRSSDQFQKRKASMQQNLNQREQLQAYSNTGAQMINVDADEYDRYKKFVLYERQKYHQNQFSKQQSREVDSGLKMYEKQPNINRDSSDDETGDQNDPQERLQQQLQFPEGDNDHDESFAQHQLNEYSSNYPIDQDDGLILMNELQYNQDKQQFKPYIIKQQPQLTTSLSTQKMQAIVSPKSIVPNTTFDTQGTTGYKISSSRDQVQQGSSIATSSIQGFKQNRSYQNTFHASSLQGISRQANNNSTIQNAKFQSNQLYQQQQFHSLHTGDNSNKKAVNNVKHLSPDPLRLPEIRSINQLEGSPIMKKGQYQLKQSPMKQRVLISQNPSIVNSYPDMPNENPMSSSVPLNFISKQSESREFQQINQKLKSSPSKK